VLYPAWTRVISVVLAVVAIPIGSAIAQTSLTAASRVVARAGADAVRLVRARRASASIAVDGKLDEPAWTHADVATGFIQQRPTPGGPATDSTDARVLFDAQALYVALRLHDAHADSLIAPLGRRDAEAYGDWAHVLIDSYYDRRTAFHFTVNPAGTRRDGLIANDQDWNEDFSWDAVWQVATSRDSLGWSAEFRIPLTQLRFDRCAGELADAITLARSQNSAHGSPCAWGIQFIRDVGRSNERSTWSPMPPDAAGYVSRFGTLGGIDGLRSPRRLEIVPYSVAQVTRAPLERGNPFVGRTAFNGALGADLGIGVTSKLSLTATINPDFGQVEADPSEVNLSGFETFLRERRPFFVEGSNIFRYLLSDGNSGEEHLFYSRRIGRAPQMGDPDDASVVDKPAATTILGAAKLSGKAGGWTLGVLDAVTDAEEGHYTTESAAKRTFTAEPRTNYAMARASRDNADGRNGVGFVATAVHRDLDEITAAELRSSAITFGIDGRVRSPGRSYFVGGNLVGSYVRGSEAAIAETQRSSVHLLQRPDRGDLFDTTRTSLTGIAAELRSMKQGGGHWRWGANGRVVTKGFEANDLGFQLRSDIASFGSWIGYVHFEPSRRIRRWDMWTNQSGMWSLTGERERLTLNLFTNVQFQNNWMVVTEVKREFSQMSTTLLRGGPATYVPANVWWWGRLVSDPRRMVSGEVMTQGYQHDRDGGSRIALFPTITVRPSSRADFSLQPGIARVRNPSQYVETASAQGDTSYVVGALTQTTTSLTARVNVTFTPTLSFQLYAQPFLSAGRYRSLGEVRDARSSDLARRVARYVPSSISTVDDDQLVVERGTGRPSVTLDKPDYSVRELKSNAVLRWEYRPGSALFLVWSQARDEESGSADFSVWRQARDLLHSAGTNVLLIKASYWLSR
jgi:hypothetical protein